MIYNYNWLLIVITMAEMDSTMQQFLSDRKLSVADLSKKASDSTETVAERRERLRKLAIEKRVSSTSTNINWIDPLLLFVCRNSRRVRSALRTTSLQWCRKILHSARTCTTSASPNAAPKATWVIWQCKKVSASETASTNSITGILVWTRIPKMLPSRLTGAWPRSSSKNSKDSEHD